jgi:hypothetical protein
MTPEQQQRMFDQRVRGLQSRISGFEQDALAEQGRGIENGPAAQALRATMNQLEQLMGKAVRNQQAMANQMSQFANNFARLSDQADTVPTILDYGQ